MSNPAVLKLADASSKKGKINRFVIEDNIGESIHLHIDNMRIDFTINEFLNFSEMIKTSVVKMDILNGYKLENFDENFLKECSAFIGDLERIEIEKIAIDKLKCIVRHKIRHDLIIQKIVPINETPAYEYLNGNKDKFIEYEQYNYFNVDNESRLNELLCSIQQSGYPKEDSYIILFNNQDIIRDGLHRATVLAHLQGMECNIKIMRFIFSGKSHYVYTKKNNAKNILKWFLIKSYRKAKGLYRK